MRLGQVHGASPCAFHHLWQIGVFLLIRSVGEDRSNRALRQTWIHGERHIGRRHIFANRCMQQIWKPLPAILFRHRKTKPAAFAILVICCFETLRRLHRTIRCAGAAFLIPGMIDRKQRTFGKLRAFGQDRLDDIG